MRRWTVLLLAGVAGCGAEPVRFQAAGGSGSADYDALGRGDVKVWIPGAYEREDGQTRVEVRFRIRNEGDQALEFDIGGTYAEVAVDGRWTRARPENPKTALFTVPAGKVEEVPLFFPLPSADVDEIEVNWTVRRAGGRVTRSSVFVASPDDPWAYHGPYYGMGLRYGSPYWPHRYWDDPFWP